MRGSDGIWTTDCRDVVGSTVFVCRTRISCDLLGRVLNTSRTVLLEVIPFFLRFRTLKVFPLASRFDMVEGQERERVILVSDVIAVRTTE